MVCTYQKLYITADKPAMGISMTHGKKTEQEKEGQMWHKSQLEDFQLTGAVSRKGETSNVLKT
jgi:hypothetical protein